MELTGPWKIQHYEVGEKHPLELAAPGLDDRFWIGAAVPGDVHSALIERGIIDPPYFGHNDAKCRWIEQKEWWYRTTFTVDEAAHQDERFELVFEGLDTFAKIYVNGHEIGSASNMLMSHTFDITRIVRAGWNSLAARFDPLFLHHRDKEQFEWSSYTKERPWIRKAAMNFGWDWGPRMVTVGIWGKVHLKRRHAAKLEGVYASTIKASAEEAIIRFEAGMKAYRKHAAATVSVCLIDADGQAVVSTELNMERGRTERELVVPHPRLWWTHDLGEPYLYTLEVKLLVDGQEVDHYVTRYGIRTIELALQDPDGNDTFTFVLNGVKVYAKGANWIPADHLIGAIRESTYRGLVELAVEGHMNMLRVWAGGIYEKDIFYDECDRQGVLVWQDFAFANALFPDFNQDFMNNVTAEVIDNVKRLRNRASLALWCGNNEIDWLYDMKSAAGDITGPFFGESIYHELIPSLLEELDPNRPYWPSSPYGASGDNDVNDPDCGDRHNWQVWHGSVYPRKYGEAPLLDYSVEGVTFKNYKKDDALFSSEFGMHASANRYTLEKNIPQGQFYWGSPEMAHRNKDTNHQKGILLMQGYTGIPHHIEEYMNFSMLTQAEGLKYGIEHFRRNNHRNRGALVWQLNDSWPGTSWSMIDYELLPKASYYYARTFFHPVLLSLEHEPGEPLKVWLVNDRLESLQGTVTLTVYSFAGEVIHRSAFVAGVPGQSTALLGERSEVEVLSGHEPGQVLIELAAAGFAAPAGRYYLRDPKEVSLPNARLEAAVHPDEGMVTVTAKEGLVRFVKLELPLGNLRFSDNYFDLLPGESRQVLIRHPEGIEPDWSQLRVSGLNAGPSI
ncbi:glycoside hydrolase family 2 protein [Paenibacillus sp. 7541]|uniref:beta-mannosidase n=1 Tax=Paenibacillus sp. 7541 TaxID=2026236 RepID=UPI000BA59459|nr:glycoside hydrolase family 2 protein [Paenibacillus sp. 7541]PAK51748.1 beta-mannosidase [Paenibacillus sp. 7541]